MSDLSLREKLRRNLHMNDHLATLGMLMRRVVEATELRCAAPTPSELLLTQSLAWQPETVFEIPFAEKTSAKFRRFVRKLHSANPASLCLFAAHSASCGWLPLESISRFSFDFEPAIFRDGAIVLVTEDLNDRLYLDGCISGDGAMMLKVQARGPGWGCINY